MHVVKSQPGVFLRLLAAGLKSKAGVLNTDVQVAGDYVGLQGDAASSMLLGNPAFYSIFDERLDRESPYQDGASGFADLSV